MGYYVPNKVKPICYNCPYRTNKYCGLLTEHDYLGDYPPNFDPYPYCPLIEVTGKIDAVRGEWVETNEVAWGATLFRCSACGIEIGDAPTLNGKPKFPYCPWCGAKMSD